MNDLAQVQFPPFKVHNRTGTVHFTLTPAHFAGETFETRNGSHVRVLKKGYMMVEMANAAEPNDGPGRVSYDWSNKVVMKLSDSDIQQILDGFEGNECRIVHDPNKAKGSASDGTLAKSFLQITKGERFGYFMTISRGDKKARCPINDADVSNFRLLLPRAVVRIYGW
ncbi:hypothetical protein D3OALGA1CA_160 [Olavius algarvensis associated proteobacterium Delta 3]|nr:hypothetical protein D3OALGA1CA_160 [Olavius algarvensis associated proteobacterium Delta 3]